MLVSSFTFLDLVDQQRGCMRSELMENMKSHCIRLVVMLSKGIYYYNTYENHQISAVDMHARGSG